ncbi:MAG TPA: nickel insertion protein, partial [bacterium]|nr:nickel insertion protein [bacterium]
MNEPQASTHETEAILFLEHVAGIAGDMFTAACINAGVVSAEEIQQIPALLGFQNSTVRITVSDLMTANMNATHVDIQWDEDAVEQLSEDHGSEDHHHITYQRIDELIRDSELSGEAKQYARQIIYLLGTSEAKVHNIDLEEVAFHEIGDIDSMLDVVMAGYCIAAISPARVYSSPVKLGRGIVEIRHGSYPIPPPASAILSEGCPVDPVPASIQHPDIELSTPTGLAILKALSP